MRLTYSMLSAGGKSVELTATDDAEIQILTALIDMKNAEELEPYLYRMMDEFRAKQVEERSGEPAHD